MNKDEDYDALSQKHLASIKRDTRVSLEDAVIRATHKVMAEPCEFSKGSCIHCGDTEQGKCEGWNPPYKRQPLTEEQMLLCWSRATCDADVYHKTYHQCLMDYGREIKSTHEEAPL